MRVNRAVLKLVFWSSLAALVHSVPCRAQVQDNLPTAESVLQRMLQRAQAMAREDNESKYTYEKRTVFEELAENGKPTRTRQKVYLVRPIQGVPFSRLIRIQNRELTEQERQVQDKREQDFRRGLAVKHPHAHDKEDEDALSPELIGRYDFKVEKRERLDNRPVLLLSFQPKQARPPEKSIEDRVLDRLAGRVWVDEADAEIARVRVGLTGDLSLGWFGMVGALRQCDVEIERQRLPDGTWVAKSFAVTLGGRKVLAPMRFRSVEEAYNFTKP